MQSREKAVVNVLILGVATLTELTLGYFFIVLLAQRVGPGGLGAYYYIISIASAATLLSNISPPQMIMIKIARKIPTLAEFLGHTLVIHCLAFVASALAMASLAVLSVRPASFKLALLVAIANSFSVIFSNLFETIAKAHEHVFPFAISRLIERLLALGLLLAVTAHASIEIVTVMTLVAVSSLTQVVTLFAGVRRYLAPVFTWSPRRLLAVMSEGRLYFIANAIAFINARTDVLMLGWLTSDEQVGYYSASLQLYNICFMTMAILDSAVFARLAALAGSNAEEFHSAVYDTARYVTALVVGASVGLVVLADDIVLLIFGEAMTRSIWVLRMLAGGLFFSSHAWLYLMMLTCADRQPLVTRMVAVTASVNLVGNYVLISTYGYVGATLATVGSAVLSFGVSLAAARRVIGSSVPVAPMLKALAAAAVMAGTIHLLVGTCALYTLVLAGGLSYLVGLVAVGYFGREDYALLRGLVAGSVNRS